MSYYNEYQSTGLNPNNEMRLDDALDAWQSAGKPAIDSADFEALADDYNIEAWELQDVINGMGDHDQVDVYY